MKRKYNDPPVVYGGDAACQHEWVSGASRGQSGGLTPKQTTNVGSYSDDVAHDTCVKCGAWRGELGWEPTPQLFVQHLVEVFSECYRVLRDDGLLFVNLMDTRVGGGGGNYGNGLSVARGRGKHPTSVYSKQMLSATNLKPKDMALVPQRFVIAMQEYGWYVRSTIIWAKGESFNPYRAGSAMPESARDRPTDTHEYIFMFSKSPRYYSDMAAVAEESKFGEHHAKYQGTYKRHKVEALQDSGAANGEQYQVGLQRPAVNPSTRNLRSVWTLPPAKLDGDVFRINTRGTSVRHYATWCNELAETMIRMSTSEHGVCSVCGAGWERVIEKGEVLSRGGSDNPDRPIVELSYTGPTNRLRGTGKNASQYANGLTQREHITVGWRPSCEHYPHAFDWEEYPDWDTLVEKNGEELAKEEYEMIARHRADLLALYATYDTVPATVLDPFGGSGTTGRAAYVLGRNSICIELKQEYHQIAEEHDPTVEKPELTIETEQHAEKGQMVLF